MKNLSPSPSLKRILLANGQASFGPTPHGDQSPCYKDTPVETGFRKPHFMAKSIFVAVWIYPTAGLPLQGRAWGAGFLD